MPKNQIIILINGNDNRIYKKNTNSLIITERENNVIHQESTILQANFNSIDDLIKAQLIINKQASPINEIIIINKDIDLNMISYQYDYNFIKNNYLKLANLFFFINLLISDFNKELSFIFSFEKYSHYKIHSNIFNQSVTNYLKLFKEDLKESHLITIKKLN